jgi:DNA-directed RNA polymerase subunit RPC12/RpoP
MSVAFELIDAPYPYICAVYRCSCGATATQHGDESATPPPHWQVQGESDDPQVRCPYCAERAGAPS